MRRRLSAVAGLPLGGCSGGETLHQASLNDGTSLTTDARPRRIRVSPWQLRPVFEGSRAAVLDLQYRSPSKDRSGGVVAASFGQNALTGREAEHGKGFLD